MAALFNPVHCRGESVGKWGLVVFYTLAIFSVVIILTATRLYILPICYIDNREFHGVDTMSAPRLLGYQLSIVELDLQLVWFLTDRLVGSTEFTFKGQKTQGGRSRRCNQAIPPERTKVCR